MLRSKEPSGFPLPKLFYPPKKVKKINTTNNCGMITISSHKN